VPVWSRVRYPRPTRLRGRGRRVDGREAALEQRILEEYEPPPGASATDGIMDFGGVKAAWFKDSEGNLLSIVEFVFIPKGVAHGFTNAGQEPPGDLGSLPRASQRRLRRCHRFQKARRTRRSSRQ
jgi:hypothetical protein